MTQINPERIKLAAIISLAALALAATLFNHWELTDGLKYWYFARVFEETGEFITFDGSPLYILYLNAFRWLGYPESVNVEYFVSSAIVMASIVVLMKRYIGTFFSAVGVLAWLPFLATAEPVAVQPLALAFSCLALVARRSDKPTTKYLGSYAFLLIGYMLRTSYLLFLVLFIAWDLYQFLKCRGWQKITPRSFIRFDSQIKSTHIISITNVISMIRRVPWSAWVVVVLVGFFVWFSTAQSSHPWNNIYVNSTQWYPIKNNAKSHSDAYFIQGFNWMYANHKYGSAAGHDFYFMNDELFNGADNSIAALRANPEFIVKQGWRNIKVAVSLVPQITVLPAIHQNLQLPFWTAFNALVLTALIVGAFKAARDGPMRIFIAASVIISATAALVLPHVIRHYIPLIPILMLSASWYGAKLQELLGGETHLRRRLLFYGGTSGAFLTVLLVLSSAFIVSNMRPITALGGLIALLLCGTAVLLSRDNSDSLLIRLRPLLRRTLVWSAVPVALVLFSNGLVTWGHNLKDLAKDAREGNLEILQGSDTPAMNASLETLQTLVSGCNGIMTLEHHFMGSFSDIPRNRIFDVWEIPPFGRLGDGDYDGLRPERVECIMESDNMAHADMRYSNHIKPYIEQLQSLGATTTVIPRYGKVIVLPNSLTPIHVP